MKPGKEDNNWRRQLKVGDLVMMKTGGMAIITEVFYSQPDDKYPHIKMIYCDPRRQRPNGCSSVRVKEIVNEAG